MTSDNDQISNVLIQYQDISGFWYTVGSSFNHPQSILIAMKNVAHMYPDRRVRAIDSDGRVVDILT